MKMGIAKNQQRKMITRGPKLIKWYEKCGLKELYKPLLRAV